PRARLHAGRGARDGDRRRAGGDHGPRGGGRSPARRSRASRLAGRVARHARGERPLVSGRMWARARRAADAVAWGLFGGLGLPPHLVGGRVPPLDPASVRRILVIRLDLLGDLVFAAPAVAALRAAYPDAELTLLTLPYTRPLAALIPGVDRTL